MNGFDTSRGEDREVQGQSINSRILDAILRHRHFLLRAENGMVRDTLRPVVGAIRQAVAELRDLDARELTPSGQIRAERIGVVAGRMVSIMGEGLGVSQQVFAGRLEEIVRREHSITSTMLRRIIPRPVSLTLPDPDDQMIRRLLDAPLAGKSWRQRYGDNAEEMARRVRSALALHTTAGDGISTITSRVRRILEDVPRNRIVTMVRTEVLRASNAVAEDIYRQNRDVIGAVQAVETLDSRTCLICAGIDGLVWDISGRPIGHSRPKPTYPIHPACRGVFAPITRPLSELGIDDSSLAPGTRASMNGQVPDSEDYRSWFARQPETFQRQVLGQSRYEKYQSGAVTLDGMVKDGRILRVGELPEAA